MRRLDFVTFHVQADAPPGPAKVLETDLEYLHLIDLMFRSALRFHPDARTTILTDRYTDLSSLRTPFSRSEHAVDPSRLMLDRTRAQLDFLEHDDSGEVVVLLDSDILINGSLSPVLDQDFDVALTWRQHADMPINAGFMLLQPRRPAVVRAFFRRFLRLYEDRYADRSGWYGDQMALRDLVGLHPDAYPNVPAVDIAGCRVRLLPCAIYNFTPRNRTRAVLRPLAEPRVLHFNGSRKRLMRLYAAAHLSGRLAAREIALDYVRRQSRRLRERLTQRVPVLRYRDS